MPEEEKTRQPERVIVGHCPDCLRVIIVENNHEMWPVVHCFCGWSGGTSAVINRRRYEREGVVSQ